MTRERKPKLLHRPAVNGPDKKNQIKNDGHVVVRNISEETERASIL